MRTASTCTRFATSAMLAGMIATFGDVDPAPAPEQVPVAEVQGGGRRRRSGRPCVTRAPPRTARPLSTRDAWRTPTISWRAEGRRPMRRGIVSRNDAIAGSPSAVPRRHRRGRRSASAAHVALLQPWGVVHGVSVPTASRSSLGTPGPAGSVCSRYHRYVRPGTGGPGRCCMTADATFCNAGPNLDLSGCASPPQFLDAPSAICRPDRCLRAAVGAPTRYASAADDPAADGT